MLANDAVIDKEVENRISRVSKSLGLSSHPALQAGCGFKRVKTKLKVGYIRHGGMGKRRLYKTVKHSLARRSRII